VLLDQLDARGRITIDEEAAPGDPKAKGRQMYDLDEALGRHILLIAWRDEQVFPTFALVGTGDTDIDESYGQDWCMTLGPEG